jgi:hypothetical protein
VPRRKDPGDVRLVGQRIVFRSKKENWELPIARVHHVRFAENSNWTESTMLDDGATFFCGCGRRLARLASCDAGFRAVLDELKARAIPVDVVEVSAPAYLD